MTKKKRFTYMEQFNGFCDVYDNGKILSCMRLEYVENTVNLLNKLYDENEQLNKVVKCQRERIIILSYLLDLADAIIDLGDDEDSKEIWEKTNDNMESKWEKLQKKAKRDYTSRGIYDD